MRISGILVLFIFLLPGRTLSANWNKTLFNDADSIKHRNTERYELNTYVLKAQRISPVSVNPTNVSVKAYPIPASTYLTIESSIKNASLNRVCIYDLMSGKMVKQVLTSNYIETIDVTGLNSGVFTVIIYQTDRISKIKIIKN